MYVLFVLNKIESCTVSVIFSAFMLQTVLLIIWHIQKLSLSHVEGTYVNIDVTCIVIDIKENIESDTVLATSLSNGIYARVLSFFLATEFWCLFLFGFSTILAMSR